MGFPKVCGSSRSLRCWSWPMGKGRSGWAVCIHLVGEFRAPLHEPINLMGELRAPLHELLGIVFKFVQSKFHFLFNQTNEKHCLRSFVQLGAQACIGIRATLCTKFSHEVHRPSCKGARSSLAAGLLTPNGATRTPYSRRSAACSR